MIPGRAHLSMERATPKNCYAKLDWCKQKERFMTEPANARDLFRAAYEHRYTWDANFPGYSADIELKQGDEVYTGHVAIKPDMTVEVSGIADEEVQQSVYT